MHGRLAFLHRCRPVGPVRAVLGKRRLSHFRVVEHTVRCQHIRGRPAAVEPGHERDLRLAVKQYIPKTNSQPGADDVTLIAAHANGFPKEMYEPLWDDLHDRLGKLGRKIRSIWIADVAHQGQSSVLNERILGNDPCWFDHSRDLLFLVNQFQDEMPHPIIGIGHSMGGTHMAHLSLLHPALMQGLILIDPVIQIENAGKAYALPSTYRRDLWPSRKEAREKFLTSPFYQQWDHRVFDKWVEYGLRDLPTELYPQAQKANGDEKAVTLTTPKVQEVSTYLRPAYENGKPGSRAGSREREMYAEDIEETYPFYLPEPPRIFRRLPEIKPNVFYIFGEKSELASKEERSKKIQTTGVGVGGSGGAAQGRVSEEVLPCGHLIPMEAPIECANASASFIDSALSQWQAEVKYFLEQWHKTPRQEKIAIDDKWRENIGALPKRNKA